MTRPATARIGVALLLVPVIAAAHTGRAPEPHDLWRAWTLAPAVLLGLAAGGALYARGLRAVWRRAGRGRAIAPWRAACYWGALAAIFVALISPVDRVGSALFSVHMTQHLLLMMVAAPLLVLGDPLAATLWALPLRWRRRVGIAWREARRWRRAWEASSSAPVAWTLHVATLWLWHLPSLYGAALRHEGVHVLEHATFFLTAVLFWRVVLAPHARRSAAGVRIFYLFAAALQSTVLGAVITLARRPWYSGHFGTTAPWGLNPLEDQQLAGLLMWIPAGVVYLVPLVPLLRSLLEEHPARGVERRGAPVLPLAQRPAAGVSARGTP